MGLLYGDKAQLWANDRPAWEWDPELERLRKLLVRTGVDPDLAFRNGRPTPERIRHRSALAERIRGARGLGFSRAQIADALDTTYENVRVLETS